MKALLPLALSAALVATAAAQMCETVKPITKSKEISYALDADSDILWLRIPDIPMNAYWVSDFTFGSKSENATFALQMKLPRNKTVFSYKFSKTGVGGALLEERLSRKWLPAGWLGVALRQSKFTLIFHREDTQLHIHLEDKQLESASYVSVSADAELGVNCSIYEETSTTTSATTTTTTTTPLTTTTTPATTTAEPTTTESNETSTSTPPDPEATLTVALANSTLSLDVQVEGITDEECNKIPLWAWVCVGLMAAFFVFFMVLLMYSIFLCRRICTLEASVARQGQYLRGRISPAGGYGEEARDMHYYGMRNQNLMIGGTTPRIKTPSPNVASHRGSNTTPRLSGYRRSISSPGTSANLTPTINFPAAPREAPPSLYLHQAQLRCTCDSEERLSSEGDAMTGRKQYDCSENNLADDERSLNSLRENAKTN